MEGVSAISDIGCMKRSDVPDVVRVHLLPSEGFFLSFLGDRFLQLHYESICNFRQPDAVENEAVCSFYEREGFVLCREYNTLENRRMREYLLEIPRLREQ